jgi:GTPase
MQKKNILISMLPLGLTAEQAEDDLIELKELVKALGTGEVVQVIQRKHLPDTGTFIGQGKAQEVADDIIAGKADIVIINNIVLPRQLHNIRTLFWNKRPEAMVWDRVDLILQVFKRHAKTAESKLQIELASLKHMGPRMFGMGGNELNRQGAGIGTKGLGETNIERMKRHWKEEIRHIQKEIKELEHVRMRQIENRKNLGLPTVSIVGYTNAGKSTLFNYVTGKEKLVKDALFATLDSVVGKLWMPKIKQQVLISDTIGFIQRLPPNLIQAFKSTLFESVHADVLLHVIDASDKKYMEKITTVEQIIKQLNVDAKAQIYVFNKIDKAAVMTASDIAYLLKWKKDNYPTFVSSVTGEGVPKLLQTIETILQTP